MPVANSPWIVASMWKPFYQHRAETFVQQIETKHQVNYMSADAFDRGALMAALHHHPSLFTYFGHGHTAGWTGFRGVRIHHFPKGDNHPLVGCVLCFSCSTFESPNNGGLSFGESLLQQQVASCVIGATGSISVAALARIADLFSVALTTKSVKTPQLLFSQVACQVKQQSRVDVLEAFEQLRCVGDDSIQLY